MISSERVTTNVLMLARWLAVYSGGGEVISLLPQKITQQLPSIRDVLDIFSSLFRLSLHCIECES